MKFNELEVGKKFIIVREQDKTMVYTKVSTNKHWNATYKNQRISVHGGTIVKERKR